MFMASFVVVLWGAFDVWIWLTVNPLDDSTTTFGVSTSLLLQDPYILGGV